MKTHGVMRCYCNNFFCSCILAAKFVGSIVLMSLGLLWMDLHIIRCLRVHGIFHSWQILTRYRFEWPETGQSLHSVWKRSMCGNLHGKSHNITECASVLKLVNLSRALSPAPSGNTRSGTCSSHRNTSCFEQFNLRLEQVLEDFSL